MSLPLSGLRVLDFSTLLPGPYATAMLAACGAEVTKIERLEGDDAAHVPPFAGGRPVLYDALNGAKHVIRLDLRAPEGLAEALRLADQADILISQFRPGVMERLGLGYEAIRARNSRLIYCAISGYGQTGPNAARAGHDLNYLADAGVFDAVAGGPAVPPGLFADVGGGSLPAILNILLALRVREVSGEGCFLDISISDNARVFIPHVTGALFSTGRFDPGASPFGGSSPRYRIYPLEGGAVVVGAFEEKFWRRFCVVIGFGETESPDAAAVQTRLMAMPIAHWQGVFAGEDCCVSVMLEGAPTAIPQAPLAMPILAHFRGL